MSKLLTDKCELPTADLPYLPTLLNRDSVETPAIFINRDAQKDTPNKTALLLSPASLPRIISVSAYKPKGQRSNVACEVVS
ncbi:hypothetical protein ACO22_03240 [Paracoccidioides brasiliensis]|uniref:Uncharacterized protein n=1 Tax=Paracoccidioides brasiliensis TaxID=121759 RepID=A0A1D2JGK0_PARBR|nr:hypothetical protein ACO22_03240 [Paracoccidioides brasiliensis]